MNFSKKKALEKSAPNFVCPEKRIERNYSSLIDLNRSIYVTL